MVELRPWLLIMFLLSFLTDTLLTRLGIRLTRLHWHLSQMPNKSEPHASPDSRPASSPLTPDAALPPTPAESAEPAAAADTAARRERFARAKSRWP
jgi:hypothetical protein